MKKRKRIIIILLSIIIFFALIFIFIYFKFPYFKSISSIKEDVLKITPYGMSIDNVYKAYENNNKWSLKKYKDEYENVIVGFHYTSFPYLWVEWIFDENNQLIDIEISKQWTP